EVLDPQQRLFLELCWAALEDAGRAPGSGEGLVSVYAGVTTSTYLLFNLARNAQLLASVDPLQLIIGNAVDSLTTRVSYRLNLKGPSHAVQCACSSSLVAVHQACQSLLNQECDLALAGGVSINVGQRAGYRFQDDSILSPDGHCRAFDAAAGGTVFGGGVGVVVLRRLEDALAARDTIRAVIRGSAVNNDGAVKVGYTAPSVDGQAAVVAEALAVAGIDGSDGSDGVDAETIGYVEGHGTGTALGDPIEIQALTKAFRKLTRKRGFAALGTVKSNIGHLDIAAGIAGLIKTVLALEHGEIPPSLHFERPNPRIDFAASPVYVSRALVPWQRGGAPRRAGVSSFGFGGTNAHVVLEEAPATPARPAADRPWHLLVLSAKTAEALAAATANLAAWFQSHPEADLGDVAYTLLAGRRVFSHRRIAVCRDAADAAACLAALDPARVLDAVDREDPGTGSEELRDGSDGVLLEVGPGRTEDSDLAHLLTAAGRRWLAGQRLDAEKLFAGEQRRRVPLPTYPFERRRYWVDPPQRNNMPAAQRQTPPPTEEDRTAEASPVPAPLPARHERPRLPNPYVSPATPEQQRLANLWQELLGVAPVGLYDNFFELGGHSLLGTQLMSRLRATFGVDLPLNALFEGPTVADMAHTLREPVKGPVRPPLRPRPAGLRSLPLSFAQQRLWFIDQLEPGSPLYNLPRALHTEGPLRVEVLTLTLSEVVRRHEALRTAFAAPEGSPVQVIRPATTFPLPCVDLSALPANRRQAEAVLLAGEEAGRPFDLARGPLFRGVLLRLADEEHVVALTMHHIVSDGWSLGILTREVAALYQAFLEGKPSPLPELPIQYGDFAVWQHSWLDQEALEGLVGYWSQRLAGAPSQLELPGARPRPAVLSPRGAACQRLIPAALLEQLRALGRSESATLFMSLLAPLQALLHSRTGATDLVVGTDIAGRDRGETEGLIGFFINQLSLRADLTGDPTLRELLRRARETAWEAYSHQDLPFDQLVEALRIERSLRRSPIFQVKLVLQNAPRESLDLPSLTFKALGSSAGMAQLDLHWSFVERGEGLWLTLTYSTDLYDEPLIDGLLDQYEAWLHSFTERPEAQLGEVVAELAQAEQDRLAARGLELKSKNLGKLRSRRRQAEELMEV
ncbi:MAG TPA: condensation domain-containing protein, partial [Thermoanaerobaculia bacterium]|nr:condensation domain-containing protein [Thermoanaerobaculia bacterium]